MLDELQLSYDDICVLQQYSSIESRQDINIGTTLPYDQSSVTNILRNPMIVSPMIHTATPEMIRTIIESKMIFALHRYFKDADEQLDFVMNIFDTRQLDYRAIESPYLYYSVGRDRKWIDRLYSAGVRRYCVDMAHGYTKACIDTVEYIRSLDPVNMIMAGNVETAAGYSRLENAGANMIRIGIAGGSICSTGKNTGIGRPMISALLDCKKYISETIRPHSRAKIIADGGIRNAADIVKAMICGADYVMCGKLFASTSLAKGPFYNRLKELTEEKHSYNMPGFKYDRYTNCEPYYVEYAGMASHKMRQHNSSHQTVGVSIEGESGLIRYTGETVNMINNIEANLRAALSYSGARNWDELKEVAIIARMSNAGINEKQTHLDVND